MSIKLAIIGSRTFIDYDKCKTEISQALKEWSVSLNDIVEIVSGGAKGADSLAERFAKENSIQMKVFKPDWNKHGRAAGIIRNTDIIGASTHVIAFPSHKGRGTQDSIRKAKSLGKKLKVVWID